MKAYNDRFIYPVMTTLSYVSDRFYEIKFKEKYTLQQFALSLNNSFTVMSTHINGRVALGGGALDNMVYESQKNLILNPKFFPREFNIFSREILPFGEEILLDDRRNFDCLGFDILGLTSIERDSLYEAILKMVNDRLSKAESL